MSEDEQEGQEPAAPAGFAEPGESTPAAAPPPGASPETPPADHTVEAASWGRRLGAFLVDNILFAIPLAIWGVGRLVAELQAVGVRFEPGSPAPTEAQIEQAMANASSFFLLAGLVQSILLALYFVILHGTTGQTLGKRLFGIRVIRDDGQPCDLASAFKRAVVYPIGAGVPTLGPAVLLLNGLWPLWDNKRQSLGDKLGATYVIRR